jgi:hypothetical protein
MIFHCLPDNKIIVGFVADEGNAKLICDAVNLRLAGKGEK